MVYTYVSNRVKGLLSFIPLNPLLQALRLA